MKRLLVHFMFPIRDLFFNSVCHVYAFILVPPYTSMHTGIHSALIIL
jgi:hypothetical protein